MEVKLPELIDPMSISFFLWLVSGCDVKFHIPPLPQTGPWQIVEKSTWLDPKLLNLGQK